MKRKRTWKLFLTSCVSALIAFGGWKIARACYWGTWEDEVSLDLYNQELGCDSTFKPFFYNPYVEFYPRQAAADIDYGKLYREMTVKEWRAYMKNNPATADVDSLVYSATIPQLTTLKEGAIAKKKKQAAAVLAQNSAAVYLVRQKDIPALDYLTFARLCERQAMTGAYETWNTPSRDTAVMLGLLRQGERMQQKAKNEFLRERYAYQLLRLERYAGRPQACIDRYEQYFGKHKSETSIARRALSMKAGALADLDRFPEARYIFAQLFDKYYPGEDWVNYARSFRFAYGPLEDTTVVTKGLKLCKNDHERAVMVALDNMMEGSDPGVAIAKVYRYEPSSPYLDVLLVRHVSQLGSDYGEKNYAGSRKMLFEIMRSGKLHCPQLWEYSAGYLAYLDGDYTDSDKWYDKAMQTAPNDSNLRAHIKIMRIMQNEGQLAGVSKPTETQLFADFHALDESPKSAAKVATAARIRLLKLLTGLYLKQGDTVKATLCQGISGLYDYDFEKAVPDYPLDDMIAFMERTDKSPFESYLDDHYEVGLANLYEQKGTYFLGEHQYAEAIKWFKKSGGSGKLWADPFLIHNRDCHDCDYEHAPKELLTKEELAQRMIELSQLAAKPGPKQAEYCFQYANGLYNMTYFGNSWIAVQYEKPAGNDITKDERDIAKYHMDCSLAQTYYEKAMKLSTDKEFAAKCCFMAAKCEQKLNYINEMTDEDQLKEGEMRFFNKLKSDYSSTKYYKEVIRECVYFDAFAKR